MLKKLKRNKQGSLVDLISIGGIILFFGLVILIGFKVTGEFNNEIQSRTDIPVEAKTSTTTLLGHYSGTMDYGFLLLCIGIAIITLILAALVRIHPVFIPLFFIGLIIIIFLSGIMSNIYQEMAANTNLIAYADQLTFVSYILNYLPLIIGIFGILLMIVQYKLWSVSNEE